MNRPGGPLNGPAWLKALGGASDAFAAAEGLCGSADDIGNVVLLGVRDDLAHVIRSLSNLAIFCGVDPSEVEAAKQR